MDKILSLDQIKNMPIDNIVQLYKDGHRIETQEQIVSAQGITISTGAILLLGLGALAFIMLKDKDII